MRNIIESKFYNNNGINFKKKINTRTFSSKYNEIVSINNENCYTINKMYTTIPRELTLSMKDDLGFQVGKHL